MIIDTKFFVITRYYRQRTVWHDRCERRKELVLLAIVWTMFFLLVEEKKNRIPITLYYEGEEKRKLRTWSTKKRTPTHEGENVTLYWILPIWKQKDNSMLGTYFTLLPIEFPTTGKKKKQQKRWQSLKTIQRFFFSLINHFFVWSLYIFVRRRTIKETH